MNSRFQRSVTCSLLFAFLFSSPGAARTTLLHSSRNGLTFRVSFDSLSLLSVQKIAENELLPPSRIEVSIGDSTAIETEVICFVIPSGAKAVLSRSDVILGERVDLSATPNPPDVPRTEVRLTEPVTIRGVRIAKVAIPLLQYRGSAWFRVKNADIEISFPGGSGEDKPVAEDRFGKMLSNVIINWEQARIWGRKAASSGAVEAYNPFANSSNWVRISTRVPGVYKIARTNLSQAGADLVDLDPRSFRLFHQGGKTLPTRNDLPRDSLEEMAIKVFGEEDGSFAGGDFILFYANGPDFWDWSQGMEFHHHPYSDRNVFFLTWGGRFTELPKRMNTIDGRPETGAEELVTEFVDRIRLEDDNSLGAESGGDINDYFSWYWSVEPRATLYSSLPAPRTGADHVLRVKAVANGVSLKINGLSTSLDSSRAPFYYFTSDYFSSGINQLDLSLTPTFRQLTYFDYIEVYYHRPLILPDGGELICYSPAVENAQGDGIRRKYQISGSFAAPYVLDISGLRGQRIVEADLNNNILSFTSDTDAESGRVFAVVNSDKLREPASVTVIEIDDLKSPANGADLLIITNDNFFSSAREFASYREERDQLRTRVVKVSDIYAQFSGGLIDPVAIRDFLRYAFLHWSGAKPSYCLLVGDGSYDFRNNLGFGAVNYIPPYIVEDDQTISDENFAYFDQPGNLDSDSSAVHEQDRGVDMVIGRWPVKSNGEFAVVADKMKRYDRGGDPGSWRNLITLVTDDENHPNSSSPEVLHTIDSEKLARDFTPTRFDLNKIYLVSYPFGAAGEKPDAREAIVRAINNGTLLVNYIGHGNPNVWADERVFRRVQEIPRLKNADRLPLIFNASCSIGFFDDPANEGMAEDLLRHPGGGAVGTVSATRLVFAFQNARFNQAAFAQLLGSTNYTIAEAVYVAKFLRQDLGGDENDRKYIYIGDPMTRLGFAPLRIDFEKFEPDSFMALSVAELAGVVKDQQGTAMSNFNGIASVNVFDNERQRHYQFNSFIGLDYVEYGPTVYRGKVEVKNGHFELKFVVPKDVSYGGRKARITVYADNGTTGATGYISPIAIGSINKEVVDTVGPEITLYFADNPEEGEGAEVAQRSRLTIELFDSLGINLSGDIGHTFAMTVDDNPNLSFSLTDSFSYLPGSYQFGTATIRLPELSPGDHELKVKAWDSGNNSSQKAIGFQVTAFEGLEISQLLCYPNPTAKECRFSYSLSEEADEVSLKIFTLSGLEIYSLRDLPSSIGYHGGVRWDGRDKDGDRIANGVYIFQLAAKPAAGNDQNGDGEWVKLAGKLVMMK